MSCGCSKKGNKSGNIIEIEIVLTPLVWGPVLWKYLHCLSEKIGISGNKMIDTDQANYMEKILQLLPVIIPCIECQQHAKEYYVINPVPSLKGLYNGELKSIVRMWLFLFHNHVRILKGQSVMESIEVYIETYQTILNKTEYQLIINSIIGAVRQGWVKMDQWRKWYSYSERLRIISGNVVV